MSLEGLTGSQKAAVLLITLGPERSADIFKHLKEEEIEELTLEIANTRSVSPEIKEEVLSEFYQVCLAQQYIAEGGIAYAKELLEKEYKVFVRKVIEGKNRVILGDNQEDTRKKAIELINTKLEAGEELYLRGNIIDLQRDTPMGGNFMAALVNIEGLGILGIIPIKKWSVGYSPLETFRGIVRNNTNAIVNFKVLQEGWIKYGNGTRRVFICSREAYLTKIGYNPWKIVCKTLSVRSVVKVRIVEEGKTAGAFFGAHDGISDFNMLCYIDDNGKLSLKDIQIGKYYYGYVQKMDSKKKYMRVRLTEPAEQGSDLKISSTLAVAQK